jgi:hypothetical protein
MAMKTKTAVFLDVIPYSLTDNYPEYGSRKFLQSSNCLLVYMASYPRR